MIFYNKKEIFIQQIYFICHTGKLCSIFPGSGTQVSMKSIFDGFLPEDEQRPKLVTAHLQFPWLSENPWQSGIAHFIKYFLSYVTDIFQTVSPTQRQTYNCYNKIFNPIWHHHDFYFHKPVSSTLSIAGALHWYVLSLHLSHAPKFQYGSEV